MEDEKDLSTEKPEEKAIPISERIYSIQGVELKFKKLLIGLRKKAILFLKEIDKYTLKNSDVSLIKDGLDGYGVIALSEFFSEEDNVKKMLYMCMDGDLSKINYSEITLEELDNVVMEIYKDFFSLFNMTMKNT